VGAGGSITRYQLDPWRRWLPGAIGLIPLGSCLVPSVLVRDGSIVPAAVILGALTTAIALSCSVARGVTLTDNALVTRSIRGRVVLPWTSIDAVQRRDRSLWVGAAGDWYVLPLGADTAPREPGSHAPLGEAVWQTWLIRRGDHPDAPPVPWTPSLDLRGRVVLRPAFTTRLRTLGGWAAIFCGQMLVPPPPASTGQPDLTIALQGRLAAFAFFSALLILYHRWTKVTIDDHEVVVRSWRGITRIPRGTIVGLREQDGGRWLGQRLDIEHRYQLPGVLDVFGGITRLPAPATGSSWLLVDPTYYRTWAWLHEVLVRQDAAVAARSRFDGSAP